MDFRPFEVSQIRTSYLDGSYIRGNLIRTPRLEVDELNVKTYTNRPWDLIPSVNIANIMTYLKPDRLEDTTDDSAEIQKAIDENYGKALFFPKGHYTISNQIFIRKSIYMFGEKGTVFKVMHRSTSWIPTFDVHNDDPELSFDMSSSANVFPTPWGQSGHFWFGIDTIENRDKIATSDYLLITMSHSGHEDYPFTMNSNTVYTTNSTWSKVGEILEVAHVGTGTDNRIYLRDAMLHNYSRYRLSTTGDTVHAPIVTKMSVIDNLVISDIEFIGVHASDANDASDDLYNNCFRFSKCVNSKLQNCIFRRFVGSCIEVSQCFNTHVQNCEIYTVAAQQEGSSSGYGISIGTASRYCSIENCRIQDCRHCIAVGGGITPSYCTIRNNYMTDPRNINHVCIDLHENAKHFLIEGNSLSGRATGIGCRAALTTVKSNRIYGCYTGINMMMLYESLSGLHNCNVIENECVNCGTGIIFRGNPTFSGSTLTAVIPFRDCIVKNNIIRTTDNWMGGFDFDNPTATDRWNIGILFLNYKPESVFDNSWSFLNDLLSLLPQQNPSNSFIFNFRNIICSNNTISFPSMDTNTRTLGILAHGVNNIAIDNNEFIGYFEHIRCSDTLHPAIKNNHIMVPTDAKRNLTTFAQSITVTESLRPVIERNHIQFPVLDDPDANNTFNCVYVGEPKDIGFSHCCINANTFVNFPHGCIELAGDWGGPSPGDQSHEPQFERTGCYIGNNIFLNCGYSSLTDVLTDFPLQSITITGQSVDNVYQLGNYNSFTMVPTI